MPRQNAELFSLSQISRGRLKGQPSRGTAELPEHTVCAPLRELPADQSRILPPRGCSADESRALPLHPLSLRSLLDQTGKGACAPVILCIGTDRIIGDSLGPLTGTLLQQSAGERLAVYGTLRDTVHALNLREALAQIRAAHPDCAVIAVDASLGACSDIGSAFVRAGSLRPGAGVSKRLPAAGDIAITGITGAESCQPYLALQTARLATVMETAEKICGCILSVCI